MALSIERQCHVAHIHGRNKLSPPSGKAKAPERPVSYQSAPNSPCPFDEAYGRKRDARLNKGLSPFATHTPERLFLSCRNSFHSQAEDGTRGNSVACEG
jgi:hypothetical protein